MNDNPSPFELHSDEHLEARITAYILGEASPFEAAEIEDLISKSPELKLFANRTRTLNELLKEAETTSNSPDSEWKLSGKRRIALAPVLGPVPALMPELRKENRIRRASFRAAFGIAAVFLITLFISPMFIRQRKKVDVLGGSQFELNVPLPTATDGSLSAKVASKPSEPAPAAEAAPQITIGGQVMNSGVVEFKEGMTLGEAVKSAGGATEFGSAKRIKVYRDGKSRTYDLTDEALAQIELQPNDTIEVPQKNFFGCGASKSELAEAAAEGKKKKPSPPASSMAKVIAAATSAEIEVPVPEIAAATPSQDFGDGADFGGGWGDASGGGGGFARKGNDESLAMDESSFRSNSAAYNGPLGGAMIPGAPPAPAITAGNRSGDARINPNNFDSIPINPNRKAAEMTDSDEAEKTGTGALGLKSQKALSDSDADPFAEPGGISGLAQREITRRELSVAEADRQLVEGREAYGKGDYQQARDKFDQALSQLPDSPALEDRRNSIADHLGKASLATAQQMRKVGKYDEARDMLEKAAAAGGENQEEIKAELAYLDDPIRTNPALTYEHGKYNDEGGSRRVSGPLSEEHGKQIDEVRRKLYMAQGSLDLGNFDEAKKTFEETLRIDPYNKAARRGMEKVEAAKSDYYRAAYDHTRTELLSQVDKAWELEVPADLIAKDKELEFDALAESKEYGYRMDTRAGSERLAADEPMKMNDLFSSSSLGQAADIRWGGLKNDLSAYGDADELDLYAGNADRTTFDAYQAPQMNGRFDGFVDFGAPIEGAPKQVKIKSKFVEISQENDEGLGFDWIVSPFKSIEGNKETKDMVIRREVPLMPNFFFDAPDDASVITKSGAAANLEVIREFTYPTEYEAPEVDEVPQLKDIPQIARLFKEKPIDLADLSNEIPATQEPFSTFSLNISDASFQVASSAVAKGERPDPESIKPEQFYNAVPYDDPAPSTGEPVAATIGQVAHPVIPGRNLVRMSVRTASTGRAATQPLVLTLLVDQSGSMARADRRAAMDTALTQLATLMQPDDRITVIGFSRTANLLADSLPGNDAAKLPDIINQASSEGGTNIEQALNLAENMALRHKTDGAQNRIVLFTDGAANLGDADPERLAERVKSLRQQDLAFDIAGIGTDDVNDRLLSELSRHGNGRYYLVGENTAGNLAKQLAGAFRPAAENVKIQVKFNPQRVGNYKLIGFEKDRLKTEDFRNDAVDAAELAADESGTALYQVEPLADGSGEIGELFVRFRDTATGEMVERSWTIPYESQAPAIDRAQPPMQLAALSILAAQKLQPGPLADAINFRDLAPTIAAVKQAYAHSPEAQQMITLINALK